MTRWALGAAGTVLAAIAMIGTAVADAPGGPRLAFARLAEQPASLTISTGDPALAATAPVAGGGSRVRPLPYPSSGPAWSPDGSSIAFSGMTGPLKGILRPGQRQIYLIGADGIGIRAIPGTSGGSWPVFSPDGRSIAFAKPIAAPRDRPDRRPWRGTAVWRVGTDGSGLRQLTEPANGVDDLPSSFSPDGSLLALTHRDVTRDRADAVALRLDGRGSYVLSRNASWPRFSPDGSRIAYLGIRRIGDTSCCELGDGFSVDLYTMSANRSSRLRLTATAAKSERAASWDPSGERLAFTTKSAPSEQSSGDLEGSVMQINADGTCLSRITAAGLRPGSHVSFRNPVWQPGPGREAGRIAC